MPSTPSVNLQLQQAHVLGWITMIANDWITIAGDVLPVKLHHQHTMAILKRAWFMTLGEKDLYIHMLSSDAKTTVSIVPYDTTDKMSRLLNGGG
eukprot:1615095-Amphidinium_carterae.1